MSRRTIILLACADLLLLIAILYKYEWKQEATDTNSTSQPLLRRMDGDTLSNEELSRLPKGVKLLQSNTLTAGRGIKSVLFNPSETLLYAFNLEEGSVMAFDRATQTLKFRLRFRQTPAKGYDYSLHKWVEGSFAEKPVEGCFTHEGRYLWTSWHNGEGIVAWDSWGKAKPTGSHTALLNMGNGETEVPLHYFKTGSTPKVMVASPDSQSLFVANWHDNTISKIDIAGDSPSQWRVTGSLKVGGTPRGMCFTSDGKDLLVGLMGSGEIARISPQTLQLLDLKEAGPTPRHLLQADQRVYVSLSSPEKIIVLDEKNLRLLNQASTQDDPRTIALSADSSLLFATCYADDLLQVFRRRDLRLLASIPSTGSPVGIDTYQKGDTVEAWVANYRYATVKVFQMTIVR